MSGWGSATPTTVDGWGSTRGNRSCETVNNDLRLSAMSLGEAAAIATPEKQFQFIVGKEQREYECSLVQACFISGKVRRLLLSDSTMSVLRVLPDEEGDVFELIERLWNGDCIEINNDIVESLLKVSRELENEELKSLLANCVSLNEEICFENCISRLHSREHLGLDSSKEFEFVASKFSEFPLQDLSSLTVSEIERILSHESLRIEDENSLWEYILDVVSRDESCSSLFKYIRFEYLDSDHLEMFLESVYPEHVECVWDSIAEFIRSSVKSLPKENPAKRNSPKTESASNRADKRVFKYNHESPWNGIFSHLSTECGGNPYLKNVIDITASSPNMSSFRGGGFEVVLENWGSYISSSVPNSWIQFDFKDRHVSVESYTLESDLCSQWKLEGSNDATSWTVLDSQYNTKVTQPTNLTCAKLTDKTFRYIRLTSTGSHRGRGGLQLYSLRLDRIEFFGTLTG